MKYINSSIEVERYEDLENKIFVYQQIKNSDSEKIITNKLPVKPGSSVHVQYFLDCDYECEKGLTSKDYKDLDNALKALILLKGDKSIDEITIAKYLKENIGIAVKNVQINTAVKRYLVLYGPGSYYYSDEINLLAPITTTKNV